jgi:hypothetical protein
MKYLSNFFLFLFVAAPIATGWNFAEHFRGSLVDVAEEEFTLKENSYQLNVEEDNDLDQEDTDYHRQLGKGKGADGKGKGKGKGSEGKGKGKGSDGKGKGKGSDGKGKGKGTEPSFLCIHDQHSLVV